MKRTKLFLVALVVAITSSSALAQWPAAPTDKLKAKEKKQVLAQPDLKIRQFLFSHSNDKAIKVLVVNGGGAGAGACRLFLTVRKIDGVSVGRKTYVNVPALGAEKSVSLIIDAKSILPNSVSLESTTFWLDVDATGIVAESDENNNERWHNL
jgi:hypothetical protein